MRSEDAKPASRPNWDEVPMSARILIVDDSPEISRLLREFLEGAGYEVREESDPRQALAAAREFQPQALIFDYHMPHLTGAELAWAFTEDAALGHLPILICTGSGFPEQ